MYNIEIEIEKIMRQSKKEYSKTDTEHGLSAQYKQIGMTKRMTFDVIEAQSDPLR